MGPRGRRSHYAAPALRGSGPAPTSCEWQPQRDRWTLIPRCPGTYRHGWPWRTGVRPAAHSASATAQTKTGAVRVRTSLLLPESQPPQPPPPASVHPGSPSRRQWSARHCLFPPCDVGGCALRREQLKGGDDYREPTLLRGFSKNELEVRRVGYMQLRAFGWATVPVPPSLDPKLDPFYLALRFGYRSTPSGTELLTSRANADLASRGTLGNGVLATRSTKQVRAHGNCSLCLSLEVVRACVHAQSLLWCLCDSLRP